MAAARDSSSRVFPFPGQAEGVPLGPAGARREGLWAPLLRGASAGPGWRDRGVVGCARPLGVGAVGVLSVQVGGQLAPACPSAGPGSAGRPWSPVGARAVPWSTFAWGRGGWRPRVGRGVGGSREGGPRSVEARGVLGTLEGPQRVGGGVRRAGIGVWPEPSSVPRARVARGMKSVEGGGGPCGGCSEAR